MKKKLLIIDRDGTIIVEPPTDYQVDSLEKLEFIPGAITNLSKIGMLHNDFDFVLASNQDGLGTDSFPEEDFRLPHEKMLTTLRGEGFEFDHQLIDKSFPEDNSPARKPGIAMFTPLLESGKYDIENSVVVGDRLTDVQLAQNLGCKAILLDRDGELSKTPEFEAVKRETVTVVSGWPEIAEILRGSSRRVDIGRKTRETDIRVSLDLDGRGPKGISTGLKFFDHMLDQIAHHSGCSLMVDCKGDLEVDEHHTIEDMAIVLGSAIRRAIGDKVGMERYGFALPMDECRALVVLDFGGRIDFDWDVRFTREYVGDVPTEMFRHFFQSLSQALEANLHIKAVGENNHHLAESVFKAFARALRAAIRRDVFSSELASSKGSL